MPEFAWIFWGVVFLFLAVKQPMALLWIAGCFAAFALASWVLWDGGWVYIVAAGAVLGCAIFGFVFGARIAEVIASATGGDE